MENFIDDLPVASRLAAVRHSYDTPQMNKSEKRQRDSLNKAISAIESREEALDALLYFSRALVNDSQNRYNEALGDYDRAVSLQTDNPFFYINRGALQAEMIDFISSMEQNVQVLSLDNSRTARARVNESRSTYDYTAAIHDMKKAAALMPEFPYSYYNLGNLYTLSSDLPEAILQYTKAIQLYPSLPEAYYNRGLVLIYLKDSEKGCLDMSKAGELGVPEAYSVISKYCIKKQ